MPQALTAARTRWFDASTTEPGQPGAFEVDPVRLTDDPTEDPVARFSFFNGKTFGPVAHSPAAAYALRFGTARIEPRAFRGLPTEA
jgi:hypothetical protein